MPIPVAARSMRWVCGRSPAGISGSNPAGSMDSLSSECCVLSGKGLCVGQITSPEESHRGWRVLRVIVQPLGHQGLSRHGEKVTSNDRLTANTSSHELKTTKTEVSLCPDRHSNRAPSEYKSQASLIQQALPRVGNKITSHNQQPFRVSLTWTHVTVFG
jgi:hypothetical protein